MRGRFTPEANAEEWCERRLLSRIHHYTLKRLRAEIEPVAARDFLRFLFDWQHVSADARMAGPKALDRVVAQLEGFEAPAAAWESEILPARLVGYEPDWLDERCLAGQIAWMRLRPRNGRTNGGGRPAPVRTTPIALLPRRHAGIWMSANSARRCAASEPPSAIDCRLHQGTRRVVLRRTDGCERPPAFPGRGSARGIGRARPCHLRQLWRTAGAACAIKRAPDWNAWTKAAPRGRLWHGGCRPLGHGPAACRSRTQGGRDRACRSHAAGALRRRILAALGA